MVEQKKERAALHGDTDRQSWWRLHEWMKQPQARKELNFEHRSGENRDKQN